MERGARFFGLTVLFTLLAAGWLITPPILAQEAEPAEGAEPAVEVVPAETTGAAEAAEPVAPAEVAAPAEVTAPAEAAETPAAVEPSLDAKGEAGKLVESGSEKMKAMDLQGAVADLQKALELDPQNEYAQKLLQQANEILAASAAGGQERVDKLLKDAEVERMIHLQMARLEMENYYNEGVKLYQAGDFKQAVDRLERAQKVLTWLAPQMDVQKYPELIGKYLADARAALARQLAAEEQKAKEQAQALASAERQRRLDAEQQRIKLLMDRAQTQFRLGNYAQAEMFANEVLAIDPNHRAAKRLAARSARVGEIDTVHQSAATRQQRDRDTLRSLDALSVPQTELLRYPENWAQIQARETGTRSIGEEEEGAEWRKRIEAAMKDKVSFEFADTALDEVLRFLHALTNVSFVLDKQAVEGKGTLNVTLALSNASLESALGYITELTGLAYTLKNEAIWITTPENAKGKAVLKLYDVSDLTVDIRDFRISTEAITLGTTDEEDKGLFPGAEEQQSTEGFTGDTLVEFIKKTIEPESWEGGGGAAAGAQPW